MNDDLIKRSDAAEVVYKALKTPPLKGVLTDTMSLAIALVQDIPSADRPSEVIYGNEHNCIMTIFGECSYSETGCGDCAVVEKVRKALSADRPQGEWIDKGRNLWGCPNCGMEIYSESEQDRNEFHKWCSRCGCRMKGADDE